MNNPYKRVCIKGLEVAFGPSTPGPMYYYDVFMYSVDKKNYIQWKNKWYSFENEDYVIDGLNRCDTDQDTDVLINNFIATGALKMYKYGLGS